MIYAQGELAYRITKNRERLCHPTYCTPLIFEQGGDWDGDWQGRTILALCCHYSMDKMQDKLCYQQLHNIINSLPSYVNKYGYFGECFDNIANEQQLSGNSWYIRGLCEYYNIFKDEKVLNILQKISQNLINKLKTFYENYPLDKREAGGVGGHLLRVIVDNWHLSTDVGCAFILLDGVTALYEIMPSKELKEIIDVMIAKYFSLEFVDKCCQTHATLSGLRGVLRYYEQTNDQKLLLNAIRIFDLYQKCGMTINYANFNWFNNPLWTEPCAIVDSVIVAKYLYVFTNDYKYLQFISRCYVNAIRSCQRINGGAGCETCLTDNNDVLSVHKYEANFCCTMRLAEGLYSLLDFLVIKNGREYTITNYLDFSYKDDNSEISMTVEYGKITKLKIMSNCDKAITLKIYKAEFCACLDYKVENNFIIANLQGKQDIVITLQMQIQKQKILDQEVYFLGDTILTQKLFDYDAKESFIINDKEYSEILNFMETEKKFDYEKIKQSL